MGRFTFPVVGVAAGSCAGHGGQMAVAGRALRGAVPGGLCTRRADTARRRQARREVGAGRDRRQQARRQRRDRHERDPRGACRRLHLRLRAGLGDLGGAQHHQGRELRLQPRLRARHARGRSALHARGAGQLSLQDAGRLHRCRARQATGHRGSRQRPRHGAASRLGAAGPCSRARSSSKCTTPAAHRPCRPRWAGRPR